MLRCKGLIAADFAYTRCVPTSIHTYYFYILLIEELIDTESYPQNGFFLSNHEAFFYEFSARTTLVDIYLDFHR